MTESRTLGDAAFVRLKADIMAGRLRCGTRLDLAALARRYELSVTPAREAALRLSGEGLIAFDRRGGFSIANPDANELSGLFTVHRDLLVSALPKSQSRTEFRPAVSEQSDRATDDYARAVRIWSTNVAALSRNPSLCAVIDRLNDRLEAFRHHEPRALPNAVSEIEKLETLYRDADFGDLRSRIRVYHQKRISNAPRLLWMAGQA